VTRLLAAVARPAEVSFETRWPARARAWVAAWGREAVPFAAVAALGLVLRLIALDAKPLHHDESLHATFAWHLATGDGYTYDPVYHGPVQFLLIGLADLVLGAGDYVTRIPPALMGTTAIFLPFFVRRQLGTLAALAASAGLCLAPSFLYQSRFAREDIYVACITLALLVVLIRFFDAPGRWHPAAFLGLLAASFATKETTYITVFLLGLFLVGALAVQGVRARRAGGRLRDGALLRSLLSLGAGAWAWGVSTFLVVFTLLFSTLLTSPEGLREGLWGSIDYWLSQQDVNRGGQPWFYYLILIPAYEWPIVILGVAGIVLVLRRPTITGALLVWWFVASLAVFSWASERMPWLMIHPLLPLVLLAGIGLQALWRGRRRLAARVALAVAALAAVGWVYSSVQLAYFRSADARELLVQVQTSDDVPVIRDELVRIQSVVTEKTQQPLVLQVDSWGGTGWPWSWYLRDLPVGYYDMSDPDQVDPGPVVLVADPNHGAMAPELRGYIAKRFRLRVWWVPDWGAAGVGDWARWAIFREAWGPTPTATMDEWLYIRPDIARLVAERPS
jgi:uncharacterized protein (TIGR03663 family)